jgi:CDP-glucose 4,6-dehydratase
MEKVGITMSSSKLDCGFWKNKRVLLTGHTGFKGAWLGLWLEKLGAKTTGISLPPNTAPNLYDLARLDSKLDSNFCDIRDYRNFSNVVRDSDPEIIFHLAAQPLVLASYQNPLETFSTNVMGTANLLEIARGLPSLKVVIAVTTDKVYKNSEDGRPFKESDPLGGLDPYSASKSAAEMIISSYQHSFFQPKKVNLSAARAGNVIGGGDWSENRIIPDAISSWQKNKTLVIRNPEAIRPWQHVLEPLFGYLILAQHSWGNEFSGGEFNFGPNIDGASSVRELIQIAREAMGYGDVEFGRGNHNLHEAKNLMLDNSKSKAILGVYPAMNLSESIEMTISWYKNYLAGKDAGELCNAEIDKYLSLK